eukprot:scaffold232875_cov27-Tisochrysis_lutea.AAC.1
MRTSTNFVRVHRDVLCEGSSEPTRRGGGGAIRLTGAEPPPERASGGMAREGRRGGRHQGE